MNDLQFKLNLVVSSEGKNNENESVIQTFTLTKIKAKYLGHFQNIVTFFLKTFTS